MARVTQALTGCVEKKAAAEEQNPVALGNTGSLRLYCTATPTAGLMHSQHIMHCAVHAPHLMRYHILIFFPPPHENSIGDQVGDCESEALSRTQLNRKKKRREICKMPHKHVSPSDGRRRHTFGSTFESTSMLRV